MQKERRHYKSMDQYIRSFPGLTRKKLKEMRNIIREQAPDAREKISYQIPTFVLSGNLVHFAGYEKHIGFYPGSRAIEVFRSKVAKYKHAKGSVQFPLDEPLPKGLIKKIVRFRVVENMKRK